MSTRPDAVDREIWYTMTLSDPRLPVKARTSSHLRYERSSIPTTLDEVWHQTKLLKHMEADVRVVGGAANAYTPSPEEERRARKQEAELIRVRTQSKDRIKEIEHKRQELRGQSPRHQSPATDGSKQ